MAERVAGGGRIIDLTVSNPGSCGLLPDPEATLNAMRSAEAIRYVPDARGTPQAREAVAAMYGGAVSPEDLLLTASTSEAYSMLFRVLCDPGDEVLIPQPGYPLFDMIGAFDSVVLKQYPLLRDHGWHIDFAALEAAITLRTRAIVIVHPNNPTGHYTDARERKELCRIARERGLALIVDEVFLEYPVEGGAGRSFAGEDEALMFVLSGLSKVCALPGMKVAWIAVCGPAELAREAKHRIELVADTFLSVAAPQQVALPTWLSQRGEVQAQIVERVKSNLAELDRQIAGTVISRLQVEAGWCVVIRIPATMTDEEMAVRLVRESGVLAQPGSQYGFQRRGWLVLSLLIPVNVFANGISLLVNGINMCNTH